MRQAITVRMPRELGATFKRYQSWRRSTSGGLRVSKQRAAEELITRGLNLWLKSIGCKPLPKDGRQTDA